MLFEDVLESLELIETTNSCFYYCLTTPNSHLSTTATFLADNPCVDCCSTLYNSHFLLYKRWPLWRGSTVFQPDIIRKTIILLSTILKKAGPYNAYIQP